MRPPSFSADTVVATLQRLHVASMPQLVAALGAPSVRTVFRKLRQVDCLTSYSHGGQYYALRSSARFDASGLWTHQGIRFSTHGTLRATLAALTAAAPRGSWRRDLEALVGVNPAAALRHLVRAGRVVRVAVDGRFLYCAADPARRQAQLAARRAPLAALRPAAPPAAPAPATAAPPEIAAALSLFTSLLNEKQRRLFGGLLALLSGRGGDQRAAAWLGLHPKTVRKGRRELASGQVTPGRVRQPGGGRKPVEKKSLPSSNAGAS